MTSTTPISRKMNLDKVSKVESSYDPVERSLGSFANSKASTSKRVIQPKANEVKSTSNHHLNEIKSNFLVNKNEGKKSGENSSNKTRKWNASCTRLVSPFSDSKSKSSNLSQISLCKKNEIRSLEKKSVEGSSKIQLDCKNDSRALMNRPKLGIPSCTNKERNRDVAEPVPVKKTQTQKTANSKGPTMRSKVKNQIPKPPPPCIPRKKVVSEDQDHPVETQKREICKIKDSKSSMVDSLKRRIPKPDDPKASTSPIVKKIDTTKTSTSSTVSREKKSQPSSSRYGQHSYTPTYHIKWEGNGKELCWEKCKICKKDLSCSPQDDDYGSHKYNEDYKYEIELESQILLPSVDILSCGHAFHSECASFDYVTPTNPQCVLCLSMT